MIDPEQQRRQPVDVCVIGAGAAGLMAAISAGRAAKARGEPIRILALDGAKTLGAKILVAGGGRCNVTHDVVDEGGASEYACGAGTSRKAIAKVLRSFGVGQTVGFFAELGVELKREETGKLFPVTDEARTVLNALLRAAREVGVEIVHPWRVGSVRVVEREDGRWFEVAAETPGVEPILARRVVLATGGKALPKTGSDGVGYGFARALGHSITEPVFPALVPLLVDDRLSFIPSLSGLTLPTTITVRGSTGKKLAEFTDSTLCTHFGLSGPSVLDISRYWSEAKRSEPGVQVVINWLPGETFESLDAMMVGAKGKTVGRWLAERLPQRLVEAICASIGIAMAASFDQLKKEDRRRLAHAVTGTVVPVTGDRGFTFAEVTAGGVPLTESELSTMESRLCPGLHLCGEICDVDGRIGGYNFQWAWASGWVAGRGAGRGAGRQEDSSAQRER